MDITPFYNCCKPVDIDYSNIDLKFRNLALNDNDIIKLVTGLAVDGSLKDPLQIGLNDSTPTPVSELCQAICRERPTFPGFTDDNEVYRFIRDRYAQFGGELDEFAQFLADQFPKEPVDPSEPVEPSEPAAPQEPNSSE